MRTYVVVISPRETDQIAGGFLPETCARLEANDRLYRLYPNNGEPAREYDFTDVDGSLILGIRSFTSQVEAKAWVARDVAQRAMLHQPTQTGRSS